MNSEDQIFQYLLTYKIICVNLRNLRINKSMVQSNLRIKPVIGTVINKSTFLEN
jgi:hypothetical protein